MTDELFDRMRDADPARSLPPVGTDRVDQLLEATMNTQHATSPSSRRPLVWLAAAAAVAVIAGTAFWMTRPGDEPSPPVAADETVTEIHAPDAAVANARCPVPNAEMLGRADVAVLATVESVGDEITLEPTQWFAGEETDRVVVSAPAADIPRGHGVPEFTEGESYYVAASAGSLMICGFSGPANDHLETLYGEAFHN